MFKHLWIVALLLVTQFGCSASLPSWVHHPVKDSHRVFYSSGSGPSLHAAQQDALNNLASRLIVNLENETRTQINKIDDKVNYGYQSDSQFKTEALDFFKIEVEKSVQDGATHHVLIAADKQQVFAAVIDKLERHLLPLVQIDLTQPKPLLANGIKLEKIAPKYQKYLSLLKAYKQDAGFVEQPLTAMQRAYRQLKTQTAFEIVTGDDPFSLKADLQRHFNAAGYFEGQGKHKLTIILVGPEVQYSQQNQYHGLLASGQMIFNFDGELILDVPFKQFSYALTKAQAASELQTQLRQFLTTAE